MKILDNIFNGNFMGAKEGIHEVLITKLSERVEEISNGYARDIFKTSKEKITSKKKSRLLKALIAMEKINKQKAAEFGRIDREV